MSVSFEVDEVDDGWVTITDLNVGEVVGFHRDEIPALIARLRAVQS